MNILAIDTATKCGWAHSCGVSGVWNFTAKRDESRDIRLLRFCQSLDTMVATHGKIDLVAFESARHAAPGMQGALVVQSEMQGVLKSWCLSVGVMYIGFSAATIKKFATGKGNAKKPQMIAAAELRFDFPVIDDNHADALWILEFARNEFPQGLPSGFTPTD